MPNISSLLRSAQTAQRKIAEQQDAQVAYDYGLSAKTYDDFVAYSKYLEDRTIAYQGDPSKLLTIQKTINAARKAYVSNEIQRQNIDIIEGRGDNNTKYEKLVELFYQAVDNDDYDQAQTLNLQLDNLSVKMQNEQIAEQEKAQRAYSNGVASGKKAITALENKIKKGPDTYVTLPDGTEVRSLASINDEIKKTGKLTLPDGSPDDPLLAAKEAGEALANIEIAKYQDPNATQEDIDALEQKYGPALQDLYSKMEVDFLGEKLSVQSLSDAKEQEARGNPLYTVNESGGPNGVEYKLTKNKIDNSEFVRNEDGSYSQIYTTARNESNYQKLSTQYDSKGNVVGDNDSIQAGTGKATDKQSFEQRLNNAGIIVQGTNKDGTVNIIDKQGVSHENATIQPDGTIRYFGQPNEYSGGSPGVYEISAFDRNIGTNGLPLNQKAGDTRAVAPDETSDFGEVSKFGVRQSFASEAGSNYMDSYRGNRSLSSVLPTDLRSAKISAVTSTPNLTGSIRVGNDFSGSGGAVTSSLLQAGLFTQRNAQAEEQKRLIQIQAQEEQQRLLQQAQAFDLNQTPVRQLAQNGALVGQLKVAQPIRTPQIKSVGVAQPGKITNVSVAKPTGSVRVEGSRYAQNVTVGSF